MYYGTVFYLVHYNTVQTFSPSHQCSSLILTHTQKGLYILLLTVGPKEITKLLDGFK